MRTAFVLIPLLAMFLTSSARSQEATIKEEEWPIKTYHFSDPDPVPILRSNPAIYPYHAFDGFTSKAVTRKWKVVVMENPYLKVFLLPEIGGKVFGAVEKSTGREFIYMNDVIKFRRIAVRGPWTSGGIEFNFGIIGHTPSTATPVDYVLRTNADGSVSCFVGAIDLPSRTRWSVAVTLPRDKAYLETAPLWNIPTPFAQSYYTWTTSAISARNDLQYYYPGRSVVPHSFSIENAPWPIDRHGRDLSRYKNNDFEGSKSYFVFGDYGDFFGAYWHDLHFGMGHWALHDDMPGQKVWIWSLSRDGAIWENLLTDTKGQYSEPQAGRLLSQVDHEFFPPYTADRWREIWFPVKEIGGIVAASPFAAMNVTRSGNALQISLCGLQSFADTLIVKTGDSVLHAGAITLRPMAVETRTVSLPDHADRITVAIGEKISWTGEKVSSLHRPLEYRTIPQGSAEGLVLSGEFHEKQRQYALALSEYLRCLDQDSNHVRALAHVALLYGRNGEPEKGLAYASRALQIAKYDPGANYAYGVLARRLGRLSDAKETLGWAARSLEYRSNAYAQLAEIAIQEHAFDRACEYALRGKEFNALNLNARLAHAVALRMKGDGSRARDVRREIQDLDPLCHEARFERFRLEPTREHLDEFRSMIRSELPHEVYLEIGVRYATLGLTDDAIAVLEQAPSHPMILYWLAFLHRNTPEKSLPFLTRAFSLSPELVFPFREESIPVLEWVSAAKPGEWEPRYYLGLILWGKGREAEALQMFDRVSDSPFAPFYLARAALKKKLSAPFISEDLEKARLLEPASWRTWHAVVEHSTEEGRDANALTLAHEAVTRFPDQVVIGMDYATALHSNGKYQECLDALAPLEVLPYEGSWEARDLYSRTHVRIALEKIKNKEWSKALHALNLSREFPEHLGTGKPWQPDERLQDLLAGVCYARMNDQKNAEAGRKRVREYTDQHGVDWGSEHYAGVIMLRASGNHNQADRLMHKWEKQDPANPLRKWLAAQSEGKSDLSLAIEKENVRDLRFLLRIDAMKMAMEP